MRIGRRVVKIVFWGSVLCMSTLAGGLWCAYSYITDSKSASRLIREKAIRYFPGSVLDPGRVRPSLLAGEVVFRDLRLRQHIDRTSFDVLKNTLVAHSNQPAEAAPGHSGGSQCRGR